MKFIMAMAIMLSHTQNELATNASGLIHNFLAVSNFGVPFFFGCSGFLFFSKINCLATDERGAYYKHFCIRLIKMYIVWSLIYFSFQVASWLLFGASQEVLFSYIHRLLMYSSYPTIWFLPALLIGVSIIYYLDKHLKLPYILIICTLLYLVCSLGESYQNIIRVNEIINYLWFNYLRIFIVFRNGVFFGAPFVFCGYISSKKILSKNNAFYDILLAFLFSILFIVESFVIKKYNYSVYTHCGIFLFPATYFIIRSLIIINIKNRDIYLHLRNLSMLIFLSQRLVLTAIPSVYPKFQLFMQEMNHYITIIFVAVIVIIFAAITEQLSKKYKFLKILW